MLTTLISFLGGTAFRLIFGSVMEFLSKKQDNELEIKRMELQDSLDAKREARDMARVRLQAELGVRQIEVQAAADVSRAELDAFTEAVRATAVKSGNVWIDAWNQGIRPAGATISLALWIASMASHGFGLQEFDQVLISAFLGIFVGERIHSKIQARG